MDYRSFFKRSLDRLKEEGGYRVFTDILRSASDNPKAMHFKKDGTQQDVTVWCSNDYLGMSQNPDVIKTTIAALQNVGVGSGGTRNISGTSHYHVLLEEELASLHKKEAGLLFTSGYVSNEASLSTLGSKLENCVFLSDERNHSSIIQGIRHSGAEKIIFKHNNVADLREKLIGIDIDRPKIIVFEAVYSMDGTISPMNEYCDLADEFNAMTYLDEVHAVGLYGKTGGGISEELGVAERIDIIEGTLSKTFGVTGGYITGSAELVDFVRSFAASFIFTTSLPPALMAGALKSIQHLRQSEAERAQFRTNVTLVKNELAGRGIPFENTRSHIVPIIIGDPKLCFSVAQDLLNNHSTYVQPINFPTVPKGSERLRVTVMPQHTPEMITNLGQALQIVWEKYGLPFEESQMVG